MKILIWDWDGTLVDTNGYKYDGIWSEVFLNEPEKQKIIKDFIKTPEGKTVNRYGLIQHTLFQTGMLEVAALNGDTLKEHPLVRKYADRYQQGAKKQTNAVGLFPGVKDMLGRLYQMGYRMYIVSGGGTDDDLNTMAEYVGIKKYFNGIFGFGARGESLISFGKQGNFDRIVKVEHNSDPSCYVVIGDGESDKAFAKEVGTKFIGIANEWNKWQTDGEKIIAVAKDVEKIFI